MSEETQQENISLVLNLHQLKTIAEAMRYKIYKIMKDREKNPTAHESYDIHITDRQKTLKILDDTITSFDPEYGSF